MSSLTTNDKRYRIIQTLLYTKMVKVCEDMYPGAHPSDVVTMLRVGMGMTQEQAAKHLGVSLSCVRQWQKPEASVQICTPKALQTKRENARRLKERRAKQRGLLP